MERSERTLVPEWLKSSGSSNGGGNSAHQFASSSLHSEDQGLLKSGRNRPSGNTSNIVSDRTTSSYFRRTSSSNGYSHSRSYSSFGRSHRDKDWDRDPHDSQDKDRSALSRQRDCFDPLDNILPSRFEKDRLRRSHSSISAKRGDSWPRNTNAESSNGNAVLKVGGSSVHKVSFEKDFPSLGVEERHGDSEIGRVPSPGLTSIQSLPPGNSSVIGGDGWTSALAEVPVPVIVTSNGNSATPVQQAVHANSVSVTLSATTGRNMAETLAHGPPRVQAAPQLSVGTQRLEELAVKQSRQLIPVTPSLPKALNLSTSDKGKLKVGPQHQNSHTVNQSPRGGPMKTEVSKIIPSQGKLQVLKPARERNGINSMTNDNLSPTNSTSTKLPNSPLANSPSVVGYTTFRNPNPNPLLANKPPTIVLERRPTVQAQSRNDFFRSVRNKSIMTNSSSASHVNEPTDNGFGGELNAIQDELSSNGGVDQRLSNGINHRHYSEEKENELLRSMGWVESAGEDEGLTEEEINSFYLNYGNPPSRNSKGGQQKSS